MMVENENNTKLHPAWVRAIRIIVIVAGVLALIAVAGVVMRVWDLPGVYIDIHYYDVKAGAWAIPAYFAAVVAIVVAISLSARRKRS